MSNIGAAPDHAGLARGAHSDRSRTWSHLAT